MGYEITSTTSTASFKLNDAEAIHSGLVAMARSEKYSNYGWRDDIGDSSSLEEALDVFCIKIVPVPDTDRATIELTDVYRSACFDDAANIFAPYMSDGVIAGTSDYGDRWTCTFKDGNATIKINELGVSDMLNVRVGVVQIKNCSENAEQFVVARAVGGELWYYGSWDTREKAERVIRDNDFSNGIVVEVEA